MSYTARLSISIPADLYDVGCAIARALDPDVGGANSFGPRERVDELGAPVLPTHYATTTPCTQAFAEQAVAMLAQPELLHAAVSADYATRWPDLTPPSLADCQAFCAGATVQVDARDTAPTTEVPGQ